MAAYSLLVLSKTQKKVVLRFAFFNIRNTIFLLIAFDCSIF